MEVSGIIDGAAPRVAALRSFSHPGRKQEVGGARALTAEALDMLLQASVTAGSKDAFSDAALASGSREVWHQFLDTLGHSCMPPADWSKSRS